MLDSIKMRGKNMFHFLMNILFNLSVKQHTYNAREKSDTIIMNTTKILLYVSQKMSKIPFLLRRTTTNLYRWLTGHQIELSNRDVCWTYLNYIWTTHNMVCLFDTMFRGYNTNAWKVIMLYWTWPRVLIINIEQCWNWIL